jgi:Na+-translocating ferredoxin:NAD+ oxidoreductase RnfD subunit
MKSEPFLPPRGDPRWYLLAYLLSFNAYALLSPDFGRSPAKFAVSVSTCVLLDFILLRLKGLKFFPLSGLITSMGTVLLCETPSLWPYAFVGAAAILSKHLIRSDGRHVFNPLTFGLVVGLLFESGDIVVVAGRWGGSPWVLAAVFALGVLAAYKSRRLDLSIAYLAATALANAARVAHGVNPTMAFGPMTGAAFQLFTFFMITDPMTTPSDRRGRLIFGVALGLLDVALRANHFRNAPFFALFVMNGLRPLWDASPRLLWTPPARA